MEVHLRCELPDKRGMLATLAGAISEAGADIQAIDVVDSRDGVATDDLWVVTDDLTAIVEHIGALEGVRLVHSGVSRGGPGDISSRMAAGLDTLLSGAMRADQALPTIIGGALLAGTAVVEPSGGWPDQKDRRVLRLPVTAGTLVLTREYRFLDPEIQRAHQLLAVCERAIAAVTAHGGS